MSQSVNRLEDLFTVFVLSSYFLKYILGTNTLTSINFRLLEELLRSAGPIWKDDHAVHTLLGRCSAELMAAIADEGGLEHWLTQNTDNISLQRNKLILNVCFYFV